jgi:hypothetical protein
MVKVRKFKIKKSFKKYNKNPLLMTRYNIIHKKLNINKTLNMILKYKTKPFNKSIKEI